MTRMHGHVFLAPGRLYFVCIKQGGAWMAAIGQGLGGAVGGALVGLAMPTVGGAPAIYDEAQLHTAVSQMPGSLAQRLGHDDPVERNSPVTQQCAQLECVRRRGRADQAVACFGHGIHMVVLA